MWQPTTWVGASSGRKHVLCAPWQERTIKQALLACDTGAYPPLESSGQGGPSTCLNMDASLPEKDSAEEQQEKQRRQQQQQLKIRDLVDQIGAACFDAEVITNSDPAAATGIEDSPGDSSPQLGASQSSPLGDGKAGTDGARKGDRPKMDSATGTTALPGQSSATDGVLSVENM